MGKSTFAQGQPPHSTINYVNTPFRPGPTPIKRSNIDAVVQREIFPRCIEDTPGAQENFHDWTITPFVRGPRGFEVAVTAVRNSDQFHVSKMIWIDPAVFVDAKDLDQLFTHLDVAIDEAVDWIAHYQDPHDTATCTDPECYC